MQGPPLNPVWKKWLDVELAEINKLSQSIVLSPENTVVYIGSPLDTEVALHEIHVPEGNYYSMHTHNAKRYNHKI